MKQEKEAEISSLLSRLNDIQPGSDSTKSTHISDKDFTNSLESEQIIKSLRLENEKLLSQLENSTKIRVSSDEQVKLAHDDGDESTTLTEITQLKSIIEEKDIKIEKLQNIVDKLMKEIKRLREASNDQKSDTSQDNMVSAKVLDETKHRLLVEKDQEISEIKANFEEEINALKDQLKISSTNNSDDKKEDSLDEIQSEVFHLRDKIQKVKADKEQMKQMYEEKLKKIKSLFTVANKNINDQRDLVTKKESEISVLNSEVESLKQELENLSIENDNLKENAESISVELSDQKSLLSLKLDDLQRKYDASLDELEKTKLDFQNYKLKAHSILSQKQDGKYADNLASLEAQVDRMGREKADLMSSLSLSKERVALLESEIKTFSDKIVAFEARAKSSETLQSRNELLEKEHDKLKNELIEQKNLAEECLKQKDGIIEKLKAQFESEKNLLLKTIEEKKSELEVFQKINEEANKKLDTAKEELEKIRNSSTSSTSRSHLNDYQQVSSSEVRQYRRDSSNSTESSQLPLNELIRSPDQSSEFHISREKEYENKIETLSELLSESEATIQQLLEQEKFLKEEIRKVDRMEKRQYMNTEYLKNIIMKFASAPGMSLVPVLAEILQLDYNEITQLKQNIQRRESFWPLS